MNDRTPRRRQGAKRDDKKRTSKNTDERNPTRSGIDYPSPKFRARNPAEEEVPKVIFPAKEGETTGVR